MSFSCGSGGGDGINGVSGTTAIVSSGPITRFGSITVNGKRFDIESATVALEDNQGTQADLRLGMFVMVEGTVDNNGVATAERIVFDDTLEGPIESIDLANLTLTILGQTVMVDAVTVIEASGQGRSLPLEDLMINDVVEVSGQVDAGGIIRASRVERKPGVFVAGVTDVELKGTISNVDDNTRTFMIGFLVVDFSGATLEGTLTNGVFVEVKGRQASLGGALQATRVEVKTPGLGARPGTQVEVEGFVVQRTSATTFIVNNQQVRHTAQTVFENGTATDIAVNVKLEVEGAVDGNGVLVAEKISFRQTGGGNIRIAARVESVTAADGRVRLLGLSVQINALTLLRDSLSDITVGDQLEIRGFVDAQGNIVASRLERTQLDDEVVLQGPVGSINNPNLSILGIAVQTDATTEFEDANDNPLTAVNFFGQIQMGDLIKAKGTLQNDGTILADEVEVEQESN